MHSPPFLFFFCIFELAFHVLFRFLSPSLVFSRDCDSIQICCLFLVVSICLHLQIWKQLFPAAMDSGKMWLLLLILAEVMCCANVKGHFVFEVDHKYGGRGGEKEAFLGAMRAHDLRRHGRNLAAIDFQLGGHLSAATGGMYFTNVTIGTPPVDYHLHVDTGSDTTWVNCHDCERCPTKSKKFGMELMRYDLAESSTGKNITCNEEFCTAAPSSSNKNCRAGRQCGFSVNYADGAKIRGYFVRDNFRFNQVTGNLQTSTINGSVAFGCSMFENTTEHVDGIVGFGRGNESILSQLASSGKAKRVFSHCLDASRGGGIFAIGEVMEPKVNRTPLIPNDSHYSVNLKSLDVGGQFLNLSTNLPETGSRRRTVIDSGVSLAFLPPMVYQQLLGKIMSRHPDLQTRIEKVSYTCFEYNQNLDDGFPIVNFHFEDSLVLPVHPRNYIFKYTRDLYCIGWQDSSMLSIDGEELILLGDIALSDKLVVYDLENQTIGWTEYNCSSSIIRVRDEETRNVYGVGSHNISAAFTLFKPNFIAILLLVASLHTLIQAATNSI